MIFKIISKKSRKKKRLFRIFIVKKEISPCPTVAKALKKRKIDGYGIFFVHISSSDIEKEMKAQAEMHQLLKYLFFFFHFTFSYPSNFLNKSGKEGKREIVHKLPSKISESN